MPSAETRRGRQATREDGDQEPEDEEVESAELPDPQDRINDFDWEDLQEKYHDMIKERGNTEQELYEEFTNLINVADSPLPRRPDLTFVCSSLPYGPTRRVLTK